MIRVFYKDCPKCQGTGEIDEFCSYCQKGKCSNCDDPAKTSFICPKCSGSAKILCSFCGSNGHCNYCQGSGPCPFCAGTNICHQCQGQKTITCLDCQGTGFTTICPVCKNSKICQKCLGRYKHTYQCYYCHGTGKIPKGKQTKDFLLDNTGIFKMLGFSVLIIAAMVYLRPFIFEITRKVDENIVQEESYQLKELKLETEECSEDLKFSRPDQLLGSLANPQIASACEYKYFLEAIRRALIDIDNIEDKEKRDYLTKISQILLHGEENNDIYQLDNQIIVIIPKPTFATKREAIFEIISYEFKNIKEYFLEKLVLKIDDNFFLVRFFENRIDMKSFLNLEEGTQAVTLPCRYISMPLAVQSSINKDRQEIMRKTFKHELMHAVLCTAVGINSWDNWPLWIKEGSASNYAEDSEDPELVAFDQEKMTITQMPYNRACYLRLFRKLLTETTLESLVKQNLSDIDSLTKGFQSSNDCNREKQKCVNSCRQEYSQIIQQGAALPYLNREIATIAEKAVECSKQCEESIFIK